MGRHTRFGVLIAALLLLVGCWSLSWQEFVAPDGRFSVLMPGIPEMQVNEVQSGLGPLTQTVFMVDRGPQAYMIGYTEFDAATLAQQSAATLLEDATGRGVAGVGGEVLEFQEIEQDGYPGRELRLEVADGDGQIHARFFLVDDRLYQISAIVATRIVDEEINQRFLDSFHPR
jgi:hypothetical protein